MDCGPASLKAFLAGHGISTNYDALRELCYTDVDGTSIDALERLANRFGLPSEQVLVPFDHVLRSDAQCLPAIAVTKLAAGGNHFMVIWRRLGKLVQVMDPGRGRHWMTAQEIENNLYVHQMPIPSGIWTAWAHTTEFIGPLSERMLELGVSQEQLHRLVDEAMQKPDWRLLASLDATTRLVESFVANRGISKGKVAAAALEKMYARERLVRDSLLASMVPFQYWTASDIGESASTFPRVSGTGEEQLLVRGAVLVRLNQNATVGKHSAGRVETAVAINALSADAERQALDQTAREPLTAAKLDAVRAESPSTIRQIWSYLYQDGLFAPSLLVIAAAMSAVTGLIQALLFKGFLEMGRYLGLVEQRVGAVFAIVVFGTVLLFIDLFSGNGIIGIGRHLEARFRVSFLSKMARLGDRYFSSRLASDLTERIHSVAGLRALPNLGTAIVRAFFSLIATTIGVIWLDPACVWYALLAVGVSLILPLIVTPLLSELQLSIATYQGALSRYYMDTLLGVVPLRAHVAEHTIKSEHERVLGDWAVARVRYQRASVAVNTCISLTGMGLSALILFAHLAHTSEASAVLLLIFWAQQIPSLGQALSSAFMQYPAQRSVALRLLEPLGAPDEHRNVVSPSPVRLQQTNGIALDLRSVGLEIGEHRILVDVSLCLPPGCHCAVVGPSGAGKTSLVGLLLGWNQATRGEIFVDGKLLDQNALARLRSETAWIDPQIHLWNDTLIANLKYGLPVSTLLDLGTVIQKTGLESVIQKLPEGLNTPLGEGGARLSEGEAQRVRLARAMLRRDARLVLMDEPFRGLDRRTRRARCAEVRAWWKDATVLCITHDIRETLDFDYVVVIVDGNTVEQGKPSDLAARPDSKYTELLADEDEMRAMFEDDSRWSRLHMEGGRVGERRERQ
jgi:ATP-binding cassette subfamily B protein